ncbi:MAG: RnfABCDGE type electron transport complex subunit D [Candidatus Auribacterota bacterium]
MATQQKKTGVLKKQAVMRKVLLATVPCIAGSVYFFGWRSLAVILVSCIAGFLTEYFFCRQRGEPATEATLVTAVLYALILPPTVPWHVLVIGIVFSVALAKEVFGGYGRNIFNPAMVARCFVYICFPLAMTVEWAQPAQGWMGALGMWSSATSPDAVTTATPLALMKAGEQSVTYAQLIFGRIPGSMGVTSALLCFIGGLYLYITKTANRKIIVIFLITYGLLSEILYRIGCPQLQGGLYALLNGGYIFGAFFMLTDPVSSPKTEQGRIIYAILVGIFAVVIRNFSVFNGGLMFALLLGNMFAPITDHIVKEIQDSRKKKQAIEAKTTS